MPQLSYARRVPVGFRFGRSGSLSFLPGSAGHAWGRCCRRFDRRQGFSVLSAAYGRLYGTVLRAFRHAARSLPEKRSSVPSEHRKKLPLRVSRGGSVAVACRVCFLSGRENGDRLSESGNCML